MAGFNIICCVVNMGDGSKTLRAAKKYGIKDGTVSIGRGTVNSRMLEFLGISDIRKEIVTMIVKNELTAKAISGISKEMAFDKPNRGIAFSYSISEFIDGKNVVYNAEISEVKDIMYNAIYVVVDKGKAEDVIDVANKAGARGGTVVNARGSGIHKTQKLFSVEIEPEKEKVFIITKKELKDTIVETIKDYLKIDEPGNGIMYVLDINEVYGLHKG